MRLVLVVGLVLLAAISEGCWPRTEGTAPDAVRRSITLAGSTSVQPFAELLADEFMASHPDIVIDVQGGGSTAGARAALTGVADIAMLSRELSEEEKSLLPVVIARDAIAIVVHPSNPVGSLDVEQVRSIFAGEAADWSEVGGIPREIHVVTREEGSGTRGAFDEIIMGGTEVTAGALVQDSNGAVRETVAADPGAIGYLSLGLVDRRVRGIQISGVVPSIASVKNGTYPVVRPFLLATRRRPDATVEGFMDFALSGTGQRLLASEGLVPVAPAGDSH